MVNLNHIYIMIRILRIAIWVHAIFLLGSCSPAAENPGKAAKAFLDAFAARDFETASKYATKDSKTLLDLIKSMMDLQGDLNFSAAGMDEETLKKAVFENQKIEGDNATVKVIAGNKSQLIKLKKEDGAWKVAIDKQTFEEAVSDKTSIPGDETNTPNDHSTQAGEKASGDSTEPIEETNINPKDTLINNN